MRWLAALLVVCSSVVAHAESKSCDGGSMKCYVTTNVSAGKRGAKTVIAGRLAKDFVSGMPGHEGSTLELGDCKVVATEVRTKKTYSTPVKNGAYSMVVAPGSYQVSFDECFGCTLEHVPPLTLKKSSAATANARCSVLGK